GRRGGAGPRRGGGPPRAAVRAGRGRGDAGAGPRRPPHPRRRLPLPDRPQPHRGAGRRPAVPPAVREGALRMTTAPSAPATGGAGFARDVATVFEREIRPSLREPLGLLLSLGQPLLLLFFFGPLLGGAQGVGAPGAGGES